MNWQKNLQNEHIPGGLSETDKKIPFQIDTNQKTHDCLLDLLFNFVSK